MAVKTVVGVLASDNLVQQRPCARCYTFSPQEDRHAVPIKVLDTRQATTKRSRVSMNSGERSCWRYVCLLRFTQRGEQEGGTESDAVDWVARGDDDDDDDDDGEMSCDSSSAAAALAASSSAAPAPASPSSTAAAASRGGRTKDLGQRREDAATRSMTTALRRHVSTQ